MQVRCKNGEKVVDRAARKPLFMPVLRLSTGLFTCCYSTSSQFFIYFL